MPAPSIADPASGSSAARLFIVVAVLAPALCLIVCSLCPDDIYAERCLRAARPQPPAL